MEKPVEMERSYEVFENDIMMYLQMYCEEQNIEDMRAASQNVWTSALYYIYKHVFRNTDRLMSHTLYNYNNIMPSNYGSYDYDAVNKVLDIYVYDMCMRFDKDITVVGFSTLTGIHRETIYGWGRDSNTGPLSNQNIDICKKLLDLREESLTGKLVSMKHPTGPAIILNKQYSYNLPGVSREQASRRSLSASELPRLGTPETENRVVLSVSGEQNRRIGDNEQ